MDLQTSINLVCSLFTIAGVVVMIFRRSERRDVTILPGAPTKVEFDRHAERNQAEHDQIFSRINTIEQSLKHDLDDKLEKMRQESNLGREKLHDRINDVMKSISRVEGRLDRLAK
jgi:hypothetical protein